MDSQQFAERITSCLPYVPNSQQAQVIGALARFCAPNAPEDSVFILNGYAGTGKTSLTGALVKALREVGVPSVLLAPTGRAAKVFAAYSGHPAYTIHRSIYTHPSVGDTSSVGRAVRENRNVNTVFIVDEASMIGGSDIPSDDGASGSNLLEDLIHFVYTGTNCRLILLGDTAQLPPVGCDCSPAMQPDVLRSYGLRVTRATLTAIARQGACSGVLYNATWLRRAMAQDPVPPEPQIFTRGFSDVSLVSPIDLAEVIESAYNHDGTDESILITRSNVRAKDFNNAIRANVLYYEEELVKGERLLVAKNNYFWCKDVKGVDFVANGDVALVDKIYGTETRYGFRFADVRLTLPDRNISFDAKIVLDTLYNEFAALPRHRLESLFSSIMADASLFDVSVPYEARLKSLKTNPHWNALQVKYAYAVTCHKAQGGQWNNVFVDLCYVPSEAMGMEFYRWLYTAVSRSRKNLYIVRNTD